MMSTEYQGSLLRIGRKMAPHIYHAYAREDRAIPERKWRETLWELHQHFPECSIDVLLGAFFYTFQKLKDPLLYTNSHLEGFSIRKVLKINFYNEFKTYYSFSSYKHIYQKAFYTLANEISLKVLSSAMFVGYLSHLYSLFPEREVVEWLVKMGCADLKDTEENRKKSWEVLPFNSKQFLMESVRTELKKRSSSHSPILILVRRWNFETLLGLTDNLYYYDLVDKIISTNKEEARKTLVKGDITTSVLDFVLEGFKEIDEGIIPSALQVEEPPVSTCTSLIVINEPSSESLIH